MWSMADLKAEARQVLSRTYGKMIVITFALCVASGILNFVVRIRGDYSEQLAAALTAFILGDEKMLRVALGIIFAVMVWGFIAGIIKTLISIFAISPFNVSVMRFLLFNRVSDDASFNELGYGFKYSYMNIVKIMFLKGLFQFLWGLLFWIPGIIKSYEYRMIPYLLAENPNLTTKEAFEQSKQMMDGEKMNAFALDVSFIGWYFLSTITCGILIFFYVMPYQMLTNTELYVVLKQKLNGQYQNYGQNANQAYNQGYDQRYDQRYDQGYNSNYNPYFSQEYNPNYNPNNDQTGGPKQ